MIFDRDRTRTCNPQIRSLVPYPLGHTTTVNELWETDWRVFGVLQTRLKMCCTLLLRSVGTGGQTSCARRWHNLHKYIYSLRYIRRLLSAWLSGLGVWFALRVREVPGSNPGWARRRLFYDFLLFEKANRANMFQNTFIFSYKIDLTIYIDSLDYSNWVTA